MSDNIECPFCGIHFPPYPYKAQAVHPPNARDGVNCPLSKFIFNNEQWNMRPPKKEVGHIPKSTQDEVEWLRAMVEKLTVAPAPLHIEYKPNEATK